MAYQTPSVSVINAPADRQPAAPGRLPGTLEVLHVRRTKVDQLGISMEGIPGSRSSKVRKARITFVPLGESVPKPMLDSEGGRMEMFYPEQERDDVMILLRSGKERLCYFWKDGKGDRVRAWLMATN
ncbi:MAG: hypothetical protein JNL05_04330 [Flavobacteriales bacterium]|nr:hypothetical protein [Flavobacteriales bacterium]